MVRKDTNKEGTPMMLRVMFFNAMPDPAKVRVRLRQSRVEGLDTVVALAVRYERWYEKMRQAKRNWLWRELEEIEPVMRYMRPEALRAMRECERRNRQMTA